MIPAVELLAAGVTVVTATHRLARELRLAYDRHHADSGLSVWPTADVLPFDAWIQRTWEAAVVGGSPAGRQRLLSDDESRLVWRQIIGDHSGALSGFGLQNGAVPIFAASAWRLCQSWGIGQSVLQAAADTDDHRIFTRWVAAYEHRLTNREWSDGGSAALLLAADFAAGLLDVPGRVAFTGFDPVTPVVRRMAGALRLIDRHQPVDEYAPGVGSRNVVRAVDEHDEFGRAVRWARERLSVRPDAAIAIVIPDLERDAGMARRIALDLLAPGWQLHEPTHSPVSISGGRQLVDFPVVHAALQLLNLASGSCSFEEASLFLRAVHSGGAENERAARAEAELDLRRQPLERVPLATLLAVTARHAPVAAGQLQMMRSFADAARDRLLPPSEWATRFAVLLEAVGWPGGRGLTSEEFQATEAWHRLIETFSSSDEVIGPVRLQDALILVGELAQNRPFQPEGVEGAVQIVSLREADGLRFDGLWICGLTADQWPPAPRPHPLLPLSVQRDVGMPDASASGLQAWLQHRFNRLLTAADEITLSWPGVQAGEEALMSPFLRTLLPETPVAPVTTGPDPADPLHPDRGSIARSALFEVVRDDPPPTWQGDPAIRGGASVLTRQAVCPARAFVEFRLGGRELEPPAMPLDHRMRGNLVHRLLERLYGHDACRHGLARVADDTLLAVFDSLATQVIGEFLPAADAFLRQLAALERQRLWLLVLSLREHEQDRPPFTVETERSWTAQIGALPLGLRLDRLDRRHSGDTVILDYKTGMFSAADWKSSRLRDCQLPLYAVVTGSSGVAVVQIGRQSVTVRGVGEPGLGIEGVQTPDRFFRASGFDWAGTLARWSAQLELLAAEFTAGDFRVDPRDSRWATGQFAGLTRIFDLPVITGDDDAEAAS